MKWFMLLECLVGRHDFTPLYDSIEHDWYGKYKVVGVYCVRCGRIKNV